jgi:fructose/tagatose bisphosphate aldolase
MLNNGLGINEAIQRSYHFAEENARGVESTAAVLLSRADEKQSDVAIAFARGCMDIARVFSIGGMILQPGYNK